MSCILSLDEGTSSARAIIFDASGNKIHTSQKSFKQIFPRPGWVEHDPEEIWKAQLEVAEEALIRASDCVAIGITNQRETTVVWDAATGKPVYNAIVWQDRRTADCCSELVPHEAMIRNRTGLLPDPYFSASKVQWILRNVPGAKERARRGELRFGTIDSWLIWKLTGGRVHATDYSNASRTMLLNIHSLKWDEELLDLFGIPASMLPDVVPSNGFIGEAEISGRRIPIMSAIGDQQSALFGQLCTNPGDVKNTYGTGCFLLMNTGEKAVESHNRLLTTIAWGMDGKVTYALEGSVFMGAATFDWLCNGLHLADNVRDLEALAASVPDNGGVYLVPAHTGLGAPYWDPEARGLICGLSRGATSAHIARAAIEGVAFRTMDVARAMASDSGLAIGKLKVDGGGAHNNLLLQFQADITGATVVRPMELETTAQGAAYAAGLAAGTWNSVEELAGCWRQDRRFSPTDADTESLRAGWSAAVRKAMVQ